MVVTQSYCQGFTKCSILNCDKGGYHTVNTTESVKANTDISFVEEDSGAMLGVAQTASTTSSATLMLNLSNQRLIFADYVNIPYIFISKVTYRIVNVELVNSSPIPIWKVIDRNKILIGINNPVAISVSYTYKLRGGLGPGTVTNIGLLTYTSVSNPELQLIDGQPTISQGVDFTNLQNNIYIWYIFNKIDRSSYGPLNYGKSYAIVAYQRSLTVNQPVLAMYTGGIIQKDNLQLLPNTCAQVGNQTTIALMVTSQNNLNRPEHVGDEYFSLGDIIFCSSPECGRCSLAFFQVATPNGCIKGNHGLSVPAIIGIVIAALVFVVLVGITYQLTVNANKNKKTNISVF